MGDDDEPSNALAALPATAAAKPVRGRPFQPGQPSANPNGRPRSDARLKAALSKLSLTAVRELGRLLRDEKTPRRTRAAIAQYICDRRLGRPATAVTGAEGAPLFPGSTPSADDPVGRLFALIARTKAAPAVGEASGSTDPSNALPAAKGAGREGVS